MYVFNDEFTLVKIHYFHFTMKCIALSSFLEMDVNAVNCRSSEATRDFKNEDELVDGNLWFFNGKALNGNSSLLPWFNIALPRRVAKLIKFSSKAVFHKLHHTKLDRDMTWTYS